MHSHIDQPDSAHTVYGPTVSACVINMQIQVETAKARKNNIAANRLRSADTASNGCVAHPGYTVVSLSLSGSVSLD